MTRRRRKPLFGRSPEEEVQDELAFHLEARIAELIAEGVSEEEARRRTMERFGAVDEPRAAMETITARRQRRAARGRWLDEVQQDVRYAFRVLWRAPFFTAAAVLMLALALGANTAIFSVVRGVLHDSLPYDDVHELVLVETEYRDGTRTLLSAPDFMSLSESQRVFDAVAAYSPGTTALVTGGDPYETTYGQVSRNFFDLTGTRVQRGRGFAESDHVPGNTQIMVLSHELWQTRFSGAPDVVGRVVQAWGQPYTVVGVLERDREFPPETGFFVPLRYNPELYDAQTARARRGEFLRTVARLRDGVDVTDAHADVRRVGGTLARDFPETNADVSFSVQPLGDATFGDMRTPLLVLLGAVGLVLLIACANVANLLLVRANARHGEFAVRAALGAGRGRLVRQLFAESILLAGLSGLVGVLLAQLGLAALVRARPIELPRMEAVSLDGTVIVFALLLSFVTGIIFGVVPAMQATGKQLSLALRAGGRGGDGGVRAANLRSGLVVAEMALAVMLLIGAGLLLRSFRQLMAVDPGFRAEGALTFTVAPEGTGFGANDQVIRFFTALEADLAALPGVSAVGRVTNVPVRYDAPTFAVRIDGRDLDPASPPTFRARMASPNYFEAMGVRMLAGRTFSDADHNEAPDVAVINATAARRWFPDRDPVGQRVSRLIPGNQDTPGTPFGEDWTIVGVVEDMLQTRPGEEPTPEMFFAHAQQPRPGMSVVVRVEGDPMAHARRIRDVVSRHAPSSPALILPLEEVLHESVARPRFFATVLGLFAGTAVLLALAGIFSVMSYIVAQRRREISVRMALGAQGRQVVWMIARDGLLLALIGLAIGLAASVAFARILESQLYAVRALDAVTFAVVSTLLMVSAAVATLLPAQKAAATDPGLALREGQ